MSSWRMSFVCYNFDVFVFHFPMDSKLCPEWHSFPFILSRCSEGRYVHNRRWIIASLFLLTITFSGSYFVSSSLTVALWLLPSAIKRMFVYSSDDFQFFLRSWRNFTETLGSFFLEMEGGLKLHRNWNHYLCTEGIELKNHVKDTERKVYGNTHSP